MIDIIFLATSASAHVAGPDAGVHHAIQLWPIIAAAVPFVLAWLAYIFRRPKKKEGKP